MRLRVLALLGVLAVVGGVDIVTAQHDRFNDPDYPGVPDELKNPESDKRVHPTIIAQLPPIFANDKTKDGWYYLGGLDISSSPVNLCLVNLYNDNEKSVEGRELYLRAVKRGDRVDQGRVDQRYAEHLIEQSGEIPKEWRDYFLIFFGTLWRDPKGDMYVPVLFWDDSNWKLTFVNINSLFYTGFRSVHSCNAK